tara:strand:+ start:75 stop:275 length:201 start_codon:yes stop_codon:yes gene_type:complete
MRKYRFIHKDKNIDEVIEAMSFKKATKTFEIKYHDLKEVVIDYINKKKNHIHRLIKIPLNKRKNKS